MKKFLLSLLMAPVFFSQAQAQISYDFGTTPQGAVAPTTGQWPNVDYLPSLNGATLGIFSRSTGANGNVQLVNAGVTEFTGSYLKFISGTTTETRYSKFGIYDATTSASQVATAQFKVFVPTESTQSGPAMGKFVIGIGSGSTYASAGAANINTSGQTFASLEFSIGTNDVQLGHYVSNGQFALPEIADFGTTYDQPATITKGAVHNFTFYMNNSANNTTYMVNGQSYDLYAGTYEIWVDGARILLEAGTGGLPQGTVLDDMTIINSLHVSTAPIIFFDDYTFNNSLTTLPVTLAKPLSAKATGANVQLSWATATESNSARFDVMRAGADGKFAKVGERATTSPAGNAYAFTHFNAPAGVNFYKLVQVDNNGKTEEFAPVSVNVGTSASQLTASATDVGVALVLTSEKAANGVVLGVTDLSGRVVAKTTVNVVAGQNSFSLPARLGAGVYVVSAIGNGIKQVKKVVKY